MGRGRMIERKKYITCLSIISAFSVICLHTNGAFWNYSKENYWFSANIIECVFYFAVPIFFMISGVTLLDYRERYTERVFFERRIKKTVLPFLGWSIIGLILKCLIGDIPIQNLNFGFIIKGIFETSFISIYWFFPVLFSVYLCMPLLASVKDKKEIYFLYVVIAFLFNIVTPFVIDLLNLDIDWPMEVCVMSGYLIYVVLGYLIANNEIPTIWRRTIYVLGVLGLLMHIIGTYILSVENDQIVRTYKGYTNLPCFLYSTAVFVFFKHFEEKIVSKKFDYCLKWLGKYTFGLYLVHYYVMVIVKNVFFEKLWGISETSLIYRLGAPWIIIPISIFIIYIMRRIPIVRLIVPE